MSDNIIAAFYCAMIFVFGALAKFHADRGHHGNAIVFAISALIWVSIASTRP